MANNLRFLDTSFLIALESTADEYHVRAKQLASKFAQGTHYLVLHWGVLLELLDGYSSLARRAKGLELIERLKAQRIYRIYSLSNQMFDEALDLYAARPDKEWGLTDCVSFVLMRQLGITEALTADQHFVQAGFRALLLEESHEFKEG